MSLWRTALSLPEGHQCLFSGRPVSGLSLPPVHLAAATAVFLSKHDCYHICHLNPTPYKAGVYTSYVALPWGFGNAFLLFALYTYFLWTLEIFVAQQTGLPSGFQVSISYACGVSLSWSSWQFCLLPKWFSTMSALGVRQLLVPAWSGIIGHLTSLVPGCWRPVANPVFLLFPYITSSVILRIPKVLYSHFSGLAMKAICILYNPAQTSCSWRAMLGISAILMNQCVPAFRFLRLPHAHQGFIFPLSHTAAIFYRAGLITASPVSVTQWALSKYLLSKCVLMLSSVFVYPFRSLFTHFIWA